MGSFYDHIMFKLNVLDKRIVGNICFFFKQNISTVDMDATLKDRGI